VLGAGVLIERERISSLRQVERLQAMSAAADADLADRHVVVVGLSQYRFK
jgi:hypothetical protein